MIRKAEKQLTQQAGILPGPRHRAAYALAVAVASALAPAVGAQATGTADRTAKSPPAIHANTFNEHVKHDAKAVGAAFKETAHRVGVAAKAVGHEIATAAKRSTAETRTAMKGDKVASTAPDLTR